MNDLKDSRNKRILNVSTQALRIIWRALLVSFCFIGAVACQGKNSAPQSPSGAQITTHHEPSISEGARCPPELKTRAQVRPHHQSHIFQDHGNQLQTLLSAADGSSQFELWHTQVAPGQSTPIHRHSSDEVFIVLSGKGSVRIGDESFSFRAPATIVAPAHIEHQLTNTGDIPTDQYVIISACSEIHNHDGKLMNLPWRREHKH